MRGSYGRFSSEGHSFRVDQAVFAHVRDGKIAELWEIADTAALHERPGQAGRRVELRLTPPAAGGWAASRLAAAEATC